MSIIHIGKKTMINWYTAEIYKQDKRYHKGERMTLKIDYENVTRESIEKYMKDNYKLPKYRYVIHETFVTKRNLVSGVEFKERYDTPYYCSPSSEAYWSM
jgi:hypothetical protein